MRDLAILGVTLALRPELAHRVDDEGNTLLHCLCSMKADADHMLREQFLERIYQMNPAALREVNAKNRTPFMCAIHKRNWGDDFFLAKLSWDEIFESHNSQKALRKFDSPSSLEARLQSLRERAGEHVERHLSPLIPDLKAIVLEYFFGDKQQANRLVSNLRYSLTEGF